MEQPRSHSWRSALLPAGATLQQAIQSLNTSALQIVLVVGPDDVLVGTVTDGDIRRGLLRGLTLDSPIDSIIYHEALVVPPRLDGATVLGLMRANEIHALPVVDDRRRVVGLLVLNELLAPVAVRPNTLVIMAGGQGSRLLPHTAHCPKPLLPVGGKPIIEHIIERAQGDGFRRFVLVVHHLSHMIEEFCDDGRRWQVEISYVREESPLGTAGGLALMPTPHEPFVVSNADVLSDVRYGELLDFHRGQDAIATMAVRPHEWTHQFGVVRINGIEIEGFEEKPVIRSHVNAGIYVLQPAALDGLVLGERCDMTTLFTRLRELGRRTIVFPMHERWMDLGVPDDLARARASVAAATAAVQLRPR